MYESVQDIKRAVKDNGGKLTLTMRELMRASSTGAIRCSENNTSKIQAELDEEGLGYFFPPKGGIDQNTVVRIIELDEAPVKQLLSKEERFGGRWNEFGAPPDEREYAIAQLNNARASRDYGVVHGRLHPYSVTAKESYEKTIERCFVCEKRVFEIHQKTGVKLPRYIQFEYFNSRKVPQELIGEAPEGMSAIEGYRIKGFGKAKEGKGVVLPVKLDTPPKRK